MNVNNFKEDYMWIKGPPFLWCPDGERPTRPNKEAQDLHQDPQVKNITVYPVLTEENADTVNKLLQYYSRWDRLQRAVAWITKAKETVSFTALHQSGQPGPSKPKITSAATNENAQTVILKGKH